MNAHLDTFVRTSIVLAVALLSMRSLNRRSAIVRRIVLSAAFTIVLFLPFAPHWRPHDATYARIIARVVAEPSQEASSVFGAAMPLATTAHAIDWLALLWVLGALVVAGRFVLGVVLARRLVQRASAPVGWNDAIAGAEHATGHRMTVRSSSEVRGPALVGVFGAKVLVPACSASWTEERKLAVLLHEHAHVAARDLVVQVVVAAACALHWFNPLVWIAARRLRVERELAADEAVVRSGIRASAYAADLLDIANGAPFGAIAMGEEPLSRRVEAIVGEPPKALDTSAVVVLVGTLVLVLGACTLASGGSTPTAKPAIDDELQTFAAGELDRAVRDSGAKGGTILVVTPKGDVLADVGGMSDRAYVTGSTMKSIVLAAAIDEGVVSETDVFDCSLHERGGRVLEDASPLGRADLAEIVAQSSNVGFAQVFDRLGGARLDGALRRFHFTPPAGLATAPAGDWDGALSAIGATMVATPREVTLAYAALADGGDGLVSTSTASRVGALLEAVTEHGTGVKARVAGTRVAGKTGSSDWNERDQTHVTYASFVGWVPAVHPRFVIFVGVESPSASEAWGGALAAPVFSRIATRALARP